MNIEKQKQVAALFLNFKQTYSASFSSPDNSVIVTFNGSMEVTRVEINKDMEKALLQDNLTEVINRGIKSVTQEINAILLQLKQQPTT